MRREHHDLAEGQSQHAVRRGDGAGRRVAGEPDAGADRGVRHHRRRSGRRDLQRHDAARRIGGRHHAGEEPLRDVDRPHHQADRRRAHQRRRRRLQPAWRVARRGPHARVQHLRVGFVARAPDAHGQRRPALRAAESVLPDQRQLHDPDGGCALRRVGRRQHRQARHADRRAAAVRPLSRPASTPTTPTGTTSRRASVRRGRSRRRPGS